jgi:5-methyltetrahydrofolate--homocysteine methyltransferase
MADCKGVIGIFPAKAMNDDIEIFDNDGKTKTATFYSIRQQSQKPEGHRNIALSDFIKPGGDYIGAFAVSTGFGVDEKVAEFEKDHDDYSAIMLKALAIVWLKHLLK